MKRSRDLRAQRAIFTRMKPGIDPAAPEVVRACTGKQNGYISRKRALEAAARASRRQGVHLYVYRCSFCRGRFHFTSKQPEKERALKVIPIPGVHNGRLGRLWVSEPDDLLVEHFVDRVFYLAGLDVREIHLTDFTALM